MTVWPTEELAALCQTITVGYVSKMADQYVPIGIPFLRSQDVAPGHIRTNDLKFISAAFHERLSKSKLSPGDVVIVRTGYPGTAAVVPSSLPNANCADLVIARPGPRLNARFLAYALNSPWGKGQIRGRLVGVAQQHFNVRVAQALKFPVPPLRIQERIASILGAYDDLIEVNRQRVTLLEEIVQRLFEEWFVRFKAPGCEFSGSTLGQRGLVSEGWQVSKVRQLVERQRNGNVYKEGECQSSGSVIVIDQSSEEQLGYHSNKPDHLATSIDPIAIFGDHTCKMQLLISPFSIGPNTIAFKAKPTVNIYYLFTLIRGLTQTREYKRHWNDLMDNEVTVAPFDLTNLYADKVRPLFQFQEMLQRQSHNLRRQRDLLLPLLISGQLSVSATEHALGAVA
jgi:type I restriction enzyme, S subunit